MQDLNPPIRDQICAPCSGNVTTRLPGNSPAWLFWESVLCPCICPPTLLTSQSLLLVPFLLPTRRSQPLTKLRSFWALWVSIPQRMLSGLLLLVEYLSQMPTPWQLRVRISWQYQVTRSRESFKKDRCRISLGIQWLKLNFQKKKKNSELPMKGTQVWFWSGK